MYIFVHSVTIFLCIYFIGKSSHFDSISVKEIERKKLFQEISSDLSRTLNNISFILLAVLPKI